MKYLYTWQLSTRHIQTTRQSIDCDGQRCHPAEYCQHFRTSDSGDKLERDFDQAYCLERPHPNRVGRQDLCLRGGGAPSLVENGKSSPPLCDMQEVEIYRYINSTPLEDA